MTRIEIAIDDLVLHGIAAEEADSVLAALRDRLGLLATWGRLDIDELTDRDVGQLRPPSTRVPTGGALGASVADSIWTAVRPTLVSEGERR